MTKTKNRGAADGAGYSGTPLSRKLGVAEGTRLLALGAPTGYRGWLAPLPEAVVFARRLDPKVDLVHLFTVERRELARRLRHLRTRIRPNAPVWVSWPKKASGVATTVTDVWSGLKLTIRRELR